VAGVERSEPPEKRAGGSLRLTTSHPLVCQKDLPHTRRLAIPGDVVYDDLRGGSFTR